MEVLMQNYGKLETLPFRSPLFVKKKATTEQLLHNINKPGSITKYFNNNIDTSNSGPPKANFVRHKPKVIPVRFIDPHGYTIYYTHDSTNLVNEN